ncbi:hypothetical protein JSO60_06755 [Riemerella anatipestifer]|uniref:hypothetical protein n=1 Tax=Riemerella anatipestifer TaxID=34085 RepID=UPI0030C4434B
MKDLDLSKLKGEEIAQWLLNNKKVTAIQLSPERTDTDDGFTHILVHKDEYVEIIYSYLKIDEDDVMQNFTIYSKRWGNIYNSYFELQTFEGEIFTGESDEILCGVFSLGDLRNLK